MRPRLTLERRYRASLDDVWDLWTTKDGLESWWGPEGFSVEVVRLELRPGGVLEYVMRAVAPPQIAFMQKAGMPLAQTVRLTYTEVAPRRRLAYVTRADFIPEVAPYDMATSVDFDDDGEEVRMVLTFDAAHDEEWTRRSRAGREMELDKLGRLLAGRRR